MLRPDDLDDVYRALAEAVQACGPRSDVFLAMLSLRLLARQPDGPAALEAVAQTLREFELHEAQPPSPGPPATERSSP